MKISVIISTYNRGQHLSGIFDSISSLKYDGSFDYEIIIVDNNSKDNTKEIVNLYKSKNNKIHYIFEPQQGVSNARNAGIDNSSGEILAFVDDDVILDENWLLNIAHFTAECDFDALSGKVLPLYPENTPQWIKDCKDVLNGPIVRHDYGETIQLYNAKMAPFIAANLAIKRKVVKKFGGFNTNLGPGKGTIGEDTEYFHRLQKANIKIFYNPNVLVFHPVDKDRMNLKYFAKWHMLYGKYLVALNNRKNDKNFVFIFGAPRYLFREIINHVWGMAKSINNRCQFIKSWNYLFIKIGMVIAYRKENYA